jgi:hypothetical protein
MGGSGRSTSTSISIKQEQEKKDGIFSSIYSMHSPSLSSISACSGSSRRTPTVTVPHQVSRVHYLSHYSAGAGRQVHHSNGIISTSDEHLAPTLSQHRQTQVQTKLALYYILRKKKNAKQKTNCGWSDMWMKAGKRRARDGNIGIRGEVLQSDWEKQYNWGIREDREDRWMTGAEGEEGGEERTAWEEAAT